MTDFAAEDAADYRQQRRGRAGFAEAEKPDRLPPHSPEAEQGVLGCILISPACLTECQQKFGNKIEVFYDLRHQRIYETLLQMDEEFEAIDMITLQSRLKAAGVLDMVGGLVYLTSLPDAVPSAANLSYYLEILEEKFVFRRLVQSCGDVIGRVYEHQGDAKSLLNSVEFDLRKVFDRGSMGLDGAITWKELMNYDTQNDANCVIGFKNGKTTRFLCKGHAAWIIAPSGAGKSSLHMRLARDMAAGKDFFGVRGRGALRVLVVQAENDDGDMAEMAQGMEPLTDADDAFDNDSSAEELLNRNILVRTVVGVIGQGFCRWLRKAIIDHKADVVLVDPLLSFAGIDVGRQDQVSQFCRVWLDPVLRETGAVLISVHHTGKPSKERKGGQVASFYEQMYDGLGSSELVNWARAVILLQPCAEQDTFRLVFAKRGKRAWATHPSGEPTQVLWLRHAQKGINWEQVEPPQEAEDAPNKGKSAGRTNKVNEICSSNLHDFCAACKGDGEGKLAISKRLESWLAKHKTDVSIDTCKRAVEELVKRGKLAKGDDGLYRKGDEA